MNKYRLVERQNKFIIEVQCTQLGYTYWNPKFIFSTFEKAREQAIMMREGTKVHMEWESAD